MSSVFSSLKPKNTVERNGFDLSRRSVFSAKCGQILPVFCQATLPDSEYKIDVKQLLRTQPLQTAAFTGFSVNYDFFFVPNNYGYTSFNEFITQRKDDVHVGQPSINDIPKLPFKQFLYILLGAAINDYILQTKFNTYGYLPNSQFTDTRAHFSITSQNMPWASVSLECIRALDMFGYGNYLPFVKAYAARILAKFVSDSKDISTPQKYYNVLSEYYQQPVDSFDELVYAVLGLAEDVEISLLKITELPDIYPTLWPFLSYNKAFYEFYRNSYYDTSFVVELCGSVSRSSQTFDYVRLFNYDDYTNSFSIFGHMARLCAMIVPKQHLYKKDLFTGVLPSTQFGDVSVMSTQNDFHNLIGKLNFTATGDQDRFVRLSVPNGQAEGAVGSSVSTNATTYQAQFRFDPALAISVLEQRRADAMQRFKERMMRAGNKVKDVFKAHGWNEPYSASEHQPIFLGTFDGRLDINTVAATVSAGDTELGQLGANGVAVVNGNKIYFKSHDFGCIVGVMYIVKDAEYDAYGVEKQHCLTDPFDYPYPELQNISLHPVDTLEISSYLRFNNSNNLFTGNIIGYLPRYMEYKTALDKVHGEFFSAPIVPTNGGVVGLNDVDTHGAFSDWVTPRIDLNTPTSLSFLYQAPNIADNIFMVASTALQDTDPFLVNCLFDCMAVEPVSVIGLPI